MTDIATTDDDFCYNRRSWPAAATTMTGEDATTTTGVAFLLPPRCLLLQPESIFATTGLSAMLEPTVRGAASSRRGCYNRLGMKLQPLAFFAGSGHRRCYNLHPRMLQPSTAGATSSDDEMERIGHGVELLERGTTVVAELQRRARVLQPQGGRELRPRARRRRPRTRRRRLAAARRQALVTGAADERMLRGRAGGQRARMRTSG